LLDRDELGFEDGVEGVVDDRALEWDGTGFGGGGVALDDDFLGAISSRTI